MSKFEEVVLQIPHAVKHRVSIVRDGDEETVTFLKDENGRIEVTLSNEKLKWSRELACYEGQRWEYISLERWNELWSILKNYKRVHRGFKKVLRMSNLRPSFSAQVRCGKRKLTVSLVRMYHKLTH
jgi:hypothetical protein